MWAELGNVVPDLVCSQRRCMVAKLRRFFCIRVVVYWGRWVDEIRLLF